MKRCFFCGHLVESNSRFCSSCGKLSNPTPEDIQELKTIKDQLIAQFKAPLDFSPQGLYNLTSYIDSAIDNIKVFGNTIQSIQEHHIRARDRPKLFKNKNWQIDAKVYLVLLKMISIAFPSREAGNPKEIIPIPPGCWNIHFKFNNIREKTDNFSKSQIEVIG